MCNLYFISILALGLPDFSTAQTSSPTVSPTTPPSLSPTSPPSSAPTQAPTQECMVTDANGTQLTAQLFADNHVNVTFDAVASELTCSEKGVCQNITVEHCEALDCVHPEACTFVETTSVQSVTCGGEACAVATLNNPSNVNCTGFGACNYATVTLPNFATMDCVDEGCSLTTVTVSDSGRGVELLCKGGGVGTCVNLVDGPGVKSVGQGTIICEGEPGSDQPCQAQQFTGLCLRCLTSDSCGTGCEFNGASCETTNPRNFGECDGLVPTSSPTVSSMPTVSMQPSLRPSVSMQPSSQPSVSPSNSPTQSSDAFLALPSKNWIAVGGLFVLLVVA